MNPYQVLLLHNELLKSILPSQQGELDQAAAAIKKEMAENPPYAVRPAPAGATAAPDSTGSAPAVAAVTTASSN